MSKQKDPQFVVLRNGLFRLASPIFAGIDFQKNARVKENTSALELVPAASVYLGDINPPQEEVEPTYISLSKGHRGNRKVARKFQKLGILTELFNRADSLAREHGTPYFSIFTTYSREKDSTAKPREEIDIGKLVRDNINMQEELSEPFFKREKYSPINEYPLIERKHPESKILEENLYLEVAFEKTSINPFKKNSNEFNVFEPAVAPRMIVHPTAQLYLPK